MNSANENGRVSNSEGVRSLITGDQAWTSVGASREHDFSLGVVIVAHKPDIVHLNDLVRTLFCALQPLASRYRIFIWDNSPLPMTDLIDGGESGQLTVMGGDGDNLGFGGAINKVIEGTKEDWYLVLNQDLRVDEKGVMRAMRAIANADPSVAVFEFAHRPSEHPKEYDPVSRETPWFSGAAFCVAGQAFREVGGFDEQLFMYGEDVDLSFRLRNRGWALIYLPDCLVFHDDIVGPHGQKPLQEVYDRANNILLRLKYGTDLVALRGVLWLLAESLYFRLQGRRIPILRILWLVSRRAMVMRAERGALKRRGIRPEFDRWRYCRHRLGGSYVMKQSAVSPKVSIVIRTMNRPRMLMEAIETAWGQSYANIEVIVVDDGEGQGKQVSDGFHPSLGREMVYVRTGGAVGRSAAGNIGLARATGEFICFLDEDDQFYSDHVEVLVSHAVTQGLRVCYALAEEVSAELAADGGWIDGRAAVRYRQEFSRVLLWYKNYLPIQSVLFGRSLFEELGGFDENLDLYEDWSLWVKYSTKCDFGFIPKVTSRYRIFTDRKARREAFGETYARVASRHEYPGFTVSPTEFRRMVAEYVRYRGLLCVTREQVLGWRDSLRALFRRPPGF